jgi:hypothetical protein
MELKQALHAPMRRDTHHPFNRTSMELKPRYGGIGKPLVILLIEPVWN